MHTLFCVMQETTVLWRSGRTEFSTYLYTGAAPADKLGPVEPEREALSLLARKADLTGVITRQTRHTTLIGQWDDG
jgi:hypothetical protein